MQEDDAEPPGEMVAALRGVLKGMHIHTLASKLDTVHDDLHKLEGWVQEMVDNLEEGVTGAFANQQDVIDRVGDRVDEIQETHKDHMETTDAHIKNNNDAIK